MATNSERIQAIFDGVKNEVVTNNRINNHLDAAINVARLRELKKLFGENTTKQNISLADKRTYFLKITNEFVRQIVKKSDLQNQQNTNTAAVEAIENGSDA